MESPDIIEDSFRPKANPIPAAPIVEEVQGNLRRNPVQLLER
jgi:hypothetical protein